MVDAFPAINYLGVLAAAIASFIIGGIWYAPPVFGKMWLQLIGKKREEMGNATPAFAGSFVSSLIAAFVLAVFIGYARATTALDGAMMGFWAWLGFIVTISAVELLFEKKPAKLFALNNVYHLIALLVMGAILGTIR